MNTRTPYCKGLISNICQAAENLDAKTIRTLLKPPITIDICYFDEHLIVISPIYCLAREGKVAAVEFLIKEFNANYDHAVIGYILGNHTDELHELLAWILTVAPDQREHLLELVTAHYALIGRDDKVKECIDNGADAASALNGYTKAGLTDQANILHSRGVKEPWAVQNYAHWGNVEMVDKLLAEGADVGLAIHGYARLGNVAEVNRLLAEEVDIDTISMAAQGFAEGGRVQQVNELLEQGADVDITFEGYLVSDYLLHLPFSYLQLFFFTPDTRMQDKILTEAKKYYPDIGKEVEKISRLMRDQQFSFSQAYQYLHNPTLRNWLTITKNPTLEQAIPFASGAEDSFLPVEIVAHLTTFLTTLSNADILEMSHKISAYNYTIANSEEFKKDYYKDKIQSPVVNDLQKYYKQSGMFKFTRDQRPQKLIESCVKVHSKAELVAVIKQEEEKLGGEKHQKKDDEYYQVLENHYKRLTN